MPLLPTSRGYSTTVDRSAVVQGADINPTAATNAQSFAASGNHKTKLGGATAQIINFATPGTAATASHFQNLDVTPASGGLTLNSNVFVNGTLIAQVGAAAPKLFGNGATTLTAAAYNISGLTIDNLPMVLNEPTAVAETFNGVTFQNFATTNTTMLSMTGPGSALTVRSVTFNNVNFQSLGAGANNYYVKLVSSNGLGLNLTMSGSNQSPQQGGNGPTLSSPPNQSTVSGATILWP